jgi:hypothetical protein
LQLRVDMRFPTHASARMYLCTSKYDIYSCFLAFKNLMCVCIYVSTNVQLHSCVLVCDVLVCMQLAVGIACAGTGLQEAIDLLEPMTKDATDFVRQVCV